MTSGHGRGFGEEQARIEVPAANDDEMFDMVNLSTRRTGVAGTIFISMRRAWHGPRIEWSPGKPEWEGPCPIVTLEDPPLAINHGLPPRVARQAETVALAWATRNRDALLSFWRDGLTWDSDDVQAFIERLARVP